MPARTRPAHRGESRTGRPSPARDHLGPRITWVAPDASRRVTVAPEGSTVVGVWSAVRNCISWSMTSCSQAFIVVASGPTVSEVPSSL